MLAALPAAPAEAQSSTPLRRQSPLRALLTGSMGDTYQAILGDLLLISVLADDTTDETAIGSLRTSLVVEHGDQLSEMINQAAHYVVGLDVITDSRSDVLRLLLDLGGDPHCVAQDQQTLLSRLCSKMGFLNCYAELSVLIERGVRLDVCFGGGKTPMHFAAEHADIDVISLVLGNGGDMTLPDDAGETPCELASRRADRTIAQAMSAYRAALVIRNAIAVARPNNIVIQPGN